MISRWCLECLIRRITTSFFKMRNITRHILITFFPKPGHHTSQFNHHFRASTLHVVIIASFDQSSSMYIHIAQHLNKGRYTVVRGRRRFSSYFCNNLGCSLTKLVGQNFEFCLCLLLELKKKTIAFQWEFLNRLQLSNGSSQSETDENLGPVGYVNYHIVCFCQLIPISVTVAMVTDV